MMGDIAHRRGGNQALKTAQNSQENICDGVSVVSNVANLQHGDLGAGVFWEFTKFIRWSYF